VTNIDREHMDCYRDMDDIERTYIEFMDRVPFYGMIVACNDNEPLRALLPRVQRRVVTYGTRADSDFRLTILERAATKGEPLSRFNVAFKERDLGEFHLRVPGDHNVLNATAAIAVGIGLEVPVEAIRAALDEFRGVDRRFQVKGRAGGVTVIDDYGHHPTEIRATLAAARQCGYKRVHVIFQPHRFTRTQLLMDEFATAFRDADTVQVLDIYAASEQPIAGVTGETLAGRIGCGDGSSASYRDSVAGAIKAVTELASDGDMVLTLGAGNVSQIGPQIVEALEGREVARGVTQPR
jgi:UDP-N-acetylmuramate--alanine ligase